MAEHRRLESRGLRAAFHAAQLLKEAFLYLDSGEPDDRSADFLMRYGPPGPGFDYRASTEVFSGRVAHGPLRVVWDTNLLIDYFDHGEAMWSGTGLPDLHDKLLSELECMHFLIALWVVRDIQFYVLEESIHDAKRKLQPSARAVRVNAFEECAAALRLSSSSQAEDDPASQEGLLHLPQSVIDEALGRVPPGLDQWVVRAAYQSGAQVFMTRDDKILRAHGEAFKYMGVAIMSPGDLLEQLIGIGAFNCLFNPRLLSWPLPDQQRVAHLIRALPNYSL